MAKEWQNILDNFSSGKSSTSQSTSSQPSTSKKTSNNNWQGILDNFSGSRKQTYADYSNGVAKRVIARAQKKKKEEEEKKKKWYEKGLFEDGYDVGDITKTILGVSDETASVKDLTVKSLKRGYYNSRYGEETFKEIFGEKNEKETYEKILAEEDYQFTPGNDAAGAVSGAMELLGQQFRQFTNPRTLAMAGSAAGMAAVAGQAGPQVLVPEEILSVPAAASAGFATGSALSNLEIEAGHAYNEMLNAGISEETAKKIALGVGTVNAGLELVQADELLKAFKATKASGATKTFTKKLADELVERGIDVAKETVQEVAQEGVTIAGTQAASKLDKDEYAYNAEEVKDRLKDTAKSSALSFGLMNAPAAAKNTASIVSEQQKANSLTTNEQKVVDKVVADRIAEQEKDGTKLSNSEKKKITESVVAEMERGYLSIDDIESALGGETYEEYKRVSEWEDGLQNEYNELHAMKRGEMTGEQLDREAHLKEQLKNVKATSSRDALKSKLSEDVFSLASGDRLLESYNERTRRGQVFEADLTKYDAKQQATIQKAIDSGILNNTNRTHEFVDIISKISADKGVLFDFTNNTKLKESGFAIDGKQVNGFVTKDGISINIDSHKAWQSTVGHEVTHVLEGTEVYTELQNTLFEYAKTKGEYDSRMEALTELYKDVKDADLSKELTADLVGEYLFTDENFIKNLSTQNRNVFQKIYDEIKYLYKVATGSKEAKELERVKRAFDKAYKEAGNGLSDTKYSISSEGKELTKEQQEFFKDSKVRDENGSLKVMYHGTPNGDFTVFKDGTYFTDNKEYADKYQNPGASSISTGKETMNPKTFEVYLDIKKPFDINDAEARNIYINDYIKGGNAMGINPYLSDVEYDKIQTIDWTEGEDLREFLIENEYDYDGLVLDEGGTGGYGDEVQSRGKSYVVFSPEQVKNVDNLKPTADPDIRYSLSDSDGKQLTKEQQEYFKDSKMRDENGNLKVMYHGSQDAGFHVFDSSMSDDGRSFFFVDRNDVAASYSGTSEIYEAKTIRTAEDMNNFLAEIGYDHYEAVEKDGKFELLENNEHVAWSDTAQGIYEEFCWYEGVGNGDANYKVYLNLKNPLEVDAEGRNWDMVSSEFSQDAYNRYQTLTAEEKAVLEQLASWEDFGIFRDELQESLKLSNTDEYSQTLASAYEKLDTEDDELDFHGLFAIASDSFSEESVRENAVKWLNTRDYAQKAKAEGYDGVIFKNIVDNGGYSNGSEGASTVAIAFDSNQIKSVANAKPTADPDIRYSLSKEGEQFGKTGQFATPATELRYEAPVAEKPSVVAPVAENSTTQPETQLTEENSTVTADDMSALFPNNAVPVQEELEQLVTERDQLYGALEIAVDRGSAAEVGKLAEEYEAINSRIKALESKEAERTGSITDADAPPEMDAPFYGESSKQPVPDDPFYERDISDVGKRNVNAYQYENPEVKPFFQEAALGMLYDVANTTKGEKWYNDELYYASGGEKGFGGTKRSTTPDIAELKDVWGYTYEQIEKGLNAIIEDDGKENNAVSKRIEFMLNDRLLKGYTDVDGRPYEPNQDYIRLLNEKQITEYSKEAFDQFMLNADQYAPTQEEYYAPMLNSDPRYEQTAPVYDLPGGQQTYVPTKATYDATPADDAAPIFESKDPNAPKGQTSLFESKKPKTSGRVARVLTKESKNAEKSGIGMKAVSAFVDKGMVFENLSLDSGNQEVQAKWNSALPANTEKKAQYFMENGAEGVKPLKDIIKDVKKTGKEEAFTDYMYHVHNVDRMSLEDRFGLENKAVFGDTITAEVSTKKVQQYEKSNPEFKAIAESVYAYNKYLRGLLVENGVISQETADLWEKEYPHYVPVRRVDQDGKNISVPLDTYKTGVNAPVKRATGGNSDIEPLFHTMAMRTEQVFSAIARNSFGIELKNTLGSTIDTQKNATGVDEAINLIEDQESNLLKPGTLYSNPTFTVFENGERVEFEITEDMYDALKPAGKLLGHRSDKITKVSEWRRNMLTTWNPVFALWRNPVKDLQDVMINSQHAAKTYAQLITPTKDNVIYQIATHGKWAAEYESNGGKGSSYFDGKNKEFKVEDNAFKKTIGFPLRALENAGEFIEEIPRLAEYIASRKEGRSVDRSMLDAARVTTNFAAGGDVTKFANAHGFTFLNASVQGASQHVRNFREATRQDGMKGFVKTLAKYTLAGIPGIILNNMIWDDDEEYEELSDYVKQNYYVVYKTKDGKFFRIPKGRTAAVMNNALEQMQHLVTGDDEADFGTFYELFMNNIAPNNPIENNILAPIKQVMDNRAWYGDDLVPTRLQDLPAEEQFDESTDALSKLIGEKTGTSPYKWNYLIDQYSGGLGDMILPMMTPEAESGDNSLVGNLLAPWKKEMTTDSTLNNKNPGNFYDLKDELDVVANGKNATEEDKMKSMYLDSVSWDMGELYAQKREIQNSDLPDDQKYAKVREIQAQINELANNALDKYNHVRINGAYAEAGDRRYDYNADKDKWYEITPKNADGSDNWYYIQEQLSHDKLGMSYDDFWNGKQPPEGGTYYAEYNDKRYNYDAEKNQWYEIRPKNDDGSDNWYYQKEQEVTKGLGISYEEYWSKPKEYNFAYDKPGKYAISQAVGGYDSYMEHYDVLENWQSDNYIGADKDSKGNSISGSRKKKVSEYIDGLDLDYGEKIILYRSVYSSKADKRAYNQDIIDYLNERDDIDYQEMKSILEELDFKVDSEGYITW